MTINFTSDPSVFDDTVAFKNLLYTVLVDNELGGDPNLAYHLSNAGTPGSGWSYGVPQFDLGSGNVCDRCPPRGVSPRAGGGGGRRVHRGGGAAPSAPPAVPGPGVPSSAATPPRSAYRATAS